MAALRKEEKTLLDFARRRERETRPGKISPHKEAQNL